MPELLNEQQRSFRVMIRGAMARATSVDPAGLVPDAVATAAEFMLVVAIMFPVDIAVMLAPDECYAMDVPSRPVGPSAVASRPVAFSTTLRLLLLTVMDLIASAFRVPRDTHPLASALRLFPNLSTLPVSRAIRVLARHEREAAIAASTPVHTVLVLVRNEGTLAITSSTPPMLCMFLVTCLRCMDDPDIPLLSPLSGQTRNGLLGLKVPRAVLPSGLVIYVLHV